MDTSVSLLLCSAVNVAVPLLAPGPTTTMRYVVASVPSNSGKLNGSVTLGRRRSAECPNRRRRYR